jgi:F420-dependent oxidoreductase-like protein
MKIGLSGAPLVQRASIDAIVAHARQGARDGLSSYWLPEHITGGLDALTLLTVIGMQVPDIELGTAVVPTYPRHPMVLAGQALTARAALGGRVTLGIGLSHVSMLRQLGLELDRPIRHLRDYLGVLLPLLRDGRVCYHGATLSCQAETFIKPQAECPVLLAAMGPQMLRLAGSLTAGTTLSWVGPKTIREHIAPRLREAAAAAARPAPRIVATLPVCVTDDEPGSRNRLGAMLAGYLELPSYRAMFEREGVDGPGQISLVGDEARVADQLRQLADAGATDFAALEITGTPDEQARTRALLRSESKGIAAPAP